MHALGSRRSPLEAFFRVLPCLVALALIGVFVLPPRPVAAESGVLLYGAEGNRLRRYDVDTIGSGTLLEDILVERASIDPEGRDINGMICPIPDGSGRFVAGEDTGQPSPPAGWGVFESDGTQVGKLTSTYFVAGAEPFGCAFTQDGLLFTTEVGSQAIGAANGQLILWFPPYDRYPGPDGTYPNDQPSDHFCKIATDVGTAGGIAIDAQGRVYVGASGQLTIYRFSPPFPTGPDAEGGCGQTDALGSPLADTVQREAFATPGSTGLGLRTWGGLAIAPNGNLWAASSLTGHIAELDLDGKFVRDVVSPDGPGLPAASANPQGIAVGPDGTLYYSDLDLMGELPDVGPGPNGKVWRTTFDESGDPNPSEVIREGLAFPDAVALVRGTLQPKGDWPSYAGGPQRLFFNPDEVQITRDNADQLVPRWTYPVDTIMTASPVVAVVDVPDEGEIQVVYLQNWGIDYEPDAVGYVHAVRLRDGTELWRFAPDPQPGASYPGAASAHVEEVAGRMTVFVPSGETLYALDAVTGEEIWRFAAGTGCVDEFGDPPGLCDHGGERNEIETSPTIGDGKVFFGMDVDDSTRGKGGFYAVDATDGRLAWFFDLETGSTCVPDPLDDIRRFDGYHSEQELGLPSEFLLTRAGCSFDRTRTGCGNVWSSPAIDPSRERIYFGSSNCDTDDLPQTPQPGPEMPPYDAALVALDFDGTPAWRWRPREVDPNDLAFGATPNLFTIDFMGAPRDVVGIGNKDGTYYVLDRDGVNEATGVAWDDPDPRPLPYWETNLVPGGVIGGIIGTAAVDSGAGRIYISTAPGQFSNQPPSPPQRPTIHALDMNTGAVVWDDLNGQAFASYAPVSAIPTVVFGGQVPFAESLVWDAQPGGPDASLLNVLRPLPLNVTGLASGAAVVDGIVVLAGGIGALVSNPESVSVEAARSDAVISAWCVPGTAGCARCGDGAVDFDEECDDGGIEEGDGCWSTCETESSLELTGVGEGGRVDLIVDGVALSIETLPGDTAADVIALIADAIANDARLAQRGVETRMLGERLQTNGTITALAIADAGLGQGVLDPSTFGNLEIGYLQRTLLDPTRRDIEAHPSCDDTPSAELGRTIPIDVWYPADLAAWEGPGDPQLALYPLNIEAKIAYLDVPVDRSIQRPLVVFSHGSGGIRTQSTALAETLASHGFIVVAPGHTGNESTGDSVCLPQALLDRSPDISFVIDEMLSDDIDNHPFDGLIDPNRIGVAGHSLGGFTAVSVASGYQGIPPDDRVKAIMAIAPATSAISDEEHAAVEIPTLLLTGTRDGLSAAHDRTLGLISSQIVHSFYVVGANHTHFANICDIANQVIEQFNLPPEDWFDFAPQFGYPFRPLLGPYLATCGPDAFPLEDALALQNQYGVAFFRTHLLGQASYAPFLDPAYAEEAQQPITTEIPEPLEIEIDDLLVLEPAPHRVTWVDPLTGMWEVMSQFNVGWGPVFVDPKALVVVAPDTVYVADPGQDAIVRVSTPWGDRKIVSSDEVGEGPSLAGLRALAVARTGAIYALLEADVLRVDPTTGDRVLLTDPAPSIALLDPRDVVVEPAPGHDLLVVDAGAAAVIAIDPFSGARSVRVSSDSGATLSMPTGIAVKDGDLLVVDRALQTLFQVVDGTTVPVSGPTRGMGIAFSIPTDVVVTSTGEIRVVDEGLDAVLSVHHELGDRSVIAPMGLPSGSGSWMSGSGSWMGSGSYMGGSGSFVPRALAVAIPEPALLARVATALAVIAMLRWRRRPDA